MKKNVAIQYQQPTIRNARDVEQTHPNYHAYVMRLTVDDVALGETFGRTPQDENQYVARDDYDKWSLRELAHLGSQSGLRLNQFQQFFTLVDQLIRRVNSPSDRLYESLYKPAIGPIYKLMMDMYVALEGNGIDHQLGDLIEDELTDQQKEYLDILFYSESHEEYERIKSIYVQSPRFSHRDFSPYNAVDLFEIYKATENGIKQAMIRNGATEEQLANAFKDSNLD